MIERNIEKGLTTMNNTFDSLHSETEESVFSILPLLFDCIPGAIIVTDLEGKIIYANKAIQNLTGYGLSDLFGKTPGILNDEDNAEELQEIISSKIRKNEKWKGVLKQRRKDGTNYMGEFEVFPVIAPDGNTIAWACTQRNVTDYIYHEQKLQESELRYRKLSELLPDIIVVHHQGKIQYINQAGSRIFGSEDKTVFIGRDVLDFVHPDFHATVLSRFQEAYEKGQRLPIIEEKLLLPDGSEFLGESMAVPIQFEGKESILSVICDINERKRSETAIREQKQELKKRLIFAQALNNLSETTISNDDIDTILESINNIIGQTLHNDYSIIYAVDYDTKKLTVKCQYTNNTDKVLIPDESFTIDINEEAREFFWNHKKVLESHEDDNQLTFVSGYMSRLIHTMLRIKSFYWHPFAFTDKGYYALALCQSKKRKFKTDELEFIVSALKLVEIAIQKINYLEDRKKALMSLVKSEKELTKSEKEKELILSAISEFVIFHDNDMRIKWANSAAHDIKGHGEIILNQYCFQVLQRTEPCSECPVYKALLTGESHKGEVYYPNGKVLHIKGFPVFDENDNIIGAVQISKDITETKEIEKEMARLERLNMIGEMAAGFGHEIRNPMSTVRGFLQFIYGKEESIHFRRYYDLMIEELDRANSIISEFLSLARDKIIERKKDCLNKIIENLFPLILADAIHDDKSVELELEDIPEIELDRKETNQLILNLVRNGLEAMSAGGCLTIKTYSRGEEVILAVQDQGSGISPEVMNKLGIPFVTTKENGTGLGLAICYSIAARHHAKIEVTSNSEGTTFFIRYKISI